MAERATPSHSPSRYAAVAALFTALEQLMHDYRSLPDSEHLTRWSEDAERITGEVARHLAVAAPASRQVPTTTLADDGAVKFSAPLCAKWILVSGL